MGLAPLVCNLVALLEHHVLLWLATVAPAVNAHLTAVAEEFSGLPEQDPPLQAVMAAALQKVRLH